MQLQPLDALQVYRLLAWAYLEAGDNPTHAMSCIKALRDLPVGISHQSVISFLALKALCQLGSLDEAETELLSVVSSSAVSLMTCLASIKVTMPDHTHLSEGTGGYNCLTHKA